SESRLQLEAKTGFDPERVSGDAEMTFEMFRPALDDVPLEEMEITVSGTISDGGLKDALPGLDLVHAEVDVQLTDNNLILTGFGDVGPAPVQFTWRDDLNDEGAPANLSASAFISPDFLNRFGFVGRAYVSGDIPVELQALVAADGVETVEIGFELQQSRIDVSEVGWIKPSGQPARATLSFDAKNEMSASTFVFNSENARFDGDVELAEAGQLQSLIVREAYLEDFLDVSGEITRNAEDGFESRLSGAFLDASAFFGDFGAVGGGGGFAFPLELDAELETLRLREGLDLRQARLDFTGSRTGVREVAARGAIGDGADTMEAVYIGPSVEEAATLQLNSDDAGFFMRGMLGQDFLSGGRLSLSGRLARGNEPAKLNLSLSDVRMREAPFLTQVLSLASLRGLADTLSGEGVLFTNIEVPVTIAGDRFIVEGARANGPALGLTLNGWFEQASNEIRISGVLVPSFGVNSMLGGVPIIGDLFVGREGEGIFSLTYSVRGTLDKAQVTINPLSAVTPGILRRIFENPADTSIPESLPTDPNLTPPAPPMGDEEFIPSAPGSNP
ncbi:MAG: AsmA-like C-terminal region-containing protein, partial [Henriciella sp.]|uniref:AsmA-like C-terminal region-containing protein n=1 Tax=Henriciella sp. TaxID=1968823 RepID=UPI003C75D76F